MEMIDVENRENGFVLRREIFIVDILESVGELETIERT